MSRLPVVQPGVLDAIHSHVNSAWARKVGGLLIGRQAVDVIEVEEALPARQTQDHAGEIAFPPVVWDEAYAALDRHPGDRIVGWYHSHPGTGVALTEYDRRMHTALFSEPTNVALVLDPVADKLAWFGWAIVSLSPVAEDSRRAPAGMPIDRQGRGRRAAVAGLVALGIAAGGAGGYVLRDRQEVRLSGGSVGPVVQGQRAEIARLRQAVQQAQQAVAEDEGTLRRLRGDLDATKSALQETRRKLRQANPPTTAFVIHYRVQGGDSLWDLARAFYGDPLEWTKILDANRDRIADPDRLTVGQNLDIPLNE
jgi:proteasome lid subunit RPN8/RPN11